MTGSHRTKVSVEDRAYDASIWKFHYWNERTSGQRSGSKVLGREIPRDASESAPASLAASKDERAEQAAGSGREIANDRRRMEAPQRKLDQ